jgi:hypothetical protein
LVMELCGRKASKGRDDNGANPDIRIIIISRRQLDLI